MNEEINQRIVANQNGLGSVPASGNGGLGQVSQPQESGYGYKRNSSLEMFELANAEKSKAKEMFYENEAMKAKAMQQDFGNERKSIENNSINSAIVNALKNGDIDEMTANEIFNDRRVDDSVKKMVADTIYPSRNVSASDVLNTKNQTLDNQAVSVDNELSNYDYNKESRDVPNFIRMR